VIGYGEGGEVKLGGASDQVVYATGAIEKAVLSVYVKMGEPRAAIRR
jgi:hypothetical protein